MHSFSRPLCLFVAKVFCAFWWLNPSCAFSWLTFGGFLPLRPHIRRQHALAQTNRLRRHLHQLIVGNKLQRLLERQLLRRHESHSFIGRRSAHIRELLLL